MSQYSFRTNCTEDWVQKGVEKNRCLEKASQSGAWISDFKKIREPHDQKNSVKILECGP